MSIMTLLLSLRTEYSQSETLETEEIQMSMNTSTQKKLSW